METMSCIHSSTSKLWYSRMSSMAFAPLVVDFVVGLAEGKVVVAAVFSFFQRLDGAHGQQVVFLYP